MLIRALLRVLRLARSRCPHCGQRFQQGFGLDLEEMACPDGHYIFRPYRGRRVVWRDDPRAVLPGESYSGR